MDFTNPYVICGCVGVVLVLLGLWRTSSGRWHHSTVWYELDMIVGASLIIIYQLHIKAYVTLPVNVFLVLICFRGLSSFAERYAHVGKYKKKRQRKRK